MYTVPNATFIKSPIRIQCRIIAGSIKLIISKLMLKKSWYDILSFRNICLTLQLSPYPDRVEVGIFMGMAFSDADLEGHELRNFQSNRRSCNDNARVSTIIVGYKSASVVVSFRRMLTCGRLVVAFDAVVLTL